MQKGSISIASVVLVLIIAAVLFLPLPYYQNTDLWCESFPPRLCKSKGWHLRPSLWREISGDLEKTVSNTPSLPPEVPSADETTNWKTYISTRYRYSIRYPEKIYELDQYLNEGKKFSLQYCPGSKQDFIDCGAPGFNYLAIYIDDEIVQGDTFDEKIKKNLYSFAPPECIKRSPGTKAVEGSFLGRKSVTYEYNLDKKTKESFCKGENLGFDEHKIIAVDNNEGLVVLAIVNASPEAKAELEKVLSTFRFD